jgi:hypothetical protein
MCPKTQINLGGRWLSFLEDYRKEVFESLAKMIVNQQSAVVVGGSGTGKSNVAGLLAARPELIFRLNLLPDQNYLFCLVDINKLSKSDPTYFYRGMLRELYKSARGEELPVADELYQLEIETRRWNDEQSWAFALEDAHELVVNRAGKRLVWLLDRFDSACQTLNDSTLDTLRSLRDNNLFNSKLFYFVFSRKPLQRLRDWKVNSEFLEIVENMCWVGPMMERDSRWNVQQIAQRQGSEIEGFGETIIVESTGGLPAFTKAASELWLKEDLLKIVSQQKDRDNEDPKEKVKKELQKRLLEQATIQRTCREIIDDLESNERQTLKYIASSRQQIRLDQSAIKYLKNHGLIKLHKYIGKNREPEERWVIFSPLFEAYLLADKGRMIITVDKLHRQLLLDGLPMDIHLPPQPYALAEHMIERPNQALTKDEMIEHLWPGDPDDGPDRTEGLHAAIGTLRRVLNTFSIDNDITPGLGERIVARGGCYIFEQKDIGQEQT